MVHDYPFCRIKQPLEQWTYTNLVQNFYGPFISANFVCVYVCVKSKINKSNINVHLMMFFKDVFIELFDTCDYMS